MVAVVGLSTVALLGWVTGQLLVAQGSSQFIPMAPSTALLFLFLGASWVAYRGKSAWSHFHTIAGIGASIVMLTCAILFLQSLGILRTSIETFLVPKPQMFGLVPMGRISPITTLALLLASVSLLLIIHPLSSRAGNLGSVSGIGVAFVGFIVVIGYLFGAPLLYGSTIVPVALTTGVALVLLGTGLSFSTGPATWPSNRFFGSSIQVRLFRPFFLLTLAITLFFGWYSAQDIPLHPALASALVLFVSLTIFSVVVSGISGTLADRITQGERAVRELAAIVKFSDDAIIGKTLEGVITSWNQGAEKLYGYSPEEVIGRSISILIPPDHPNELQEILEQVRKGESLPQFDTHRLRKDGTLVNVSLTISPIKDAAGRTIEASTIARDITERIRMEKKLSEYADNLEELVDERTRSLVESESRTRLITDSLPALISYLDTELKYRFANKAYEEWFGKSPSEIIGQSFRDVLGESAYPRIISHLNSALSGEAQSFDYELVHRSLGKRFLTARYLPDFGANHQVKGVFVLGIDVTDRKRADNALQESEKKYRELFEASPVSLWEEDFSAVKEYFGELRSRGVVDLRRYLLDHPEEIDRCARLVRILSVNPATLKLYHAKGVDELVDGLSKVLAIGSRDVFREEILALVQGKHEFATEIDNKTLQGETRHVSVTCTIVPGYEKSLGRVLVSIVDLTTQIEMQQQVMRSQRLAVIGETAAMVGHDLRNPLQGITGALSLLQDDSLTKEERAEMHQLIQHDIEFADAIVRDLLDYSAEIRLSLEETTLRSIARESIAGLTVPPNVTIEDLSEDKSRVRIDSKRMKRVFTNLIKNAIDAMPEGGKITIASKNSNSTAEITISDTGAGMPASFTENVWKPFQTTKAKGLGLGLAICKRIVDAHGGDISLSSEIGEGTTVTIHLPIEPIGEEIKD